MFVIFAAALLEAQVVEVVGVSIPGIEKEGEITHATRVSLLKRMGIITDHVAEALTAFCIIRNVFAHEPFACTFGAQKVVAHASNLKKALIKETGEPDLATYAKVYKHVEAETLRLGGRTKWDHDVARTVIIGYLVLSYYLVWAKRLATPPRPALSVNNICQAVGSRLERVANAEPGARPSAGSADAPPASMS